jgi:hypothetical protein
MQIAPTCINMTGGFSMPFPSTDKPTLSAFIDTIENGLFHITYCCIDRVASAPQQLPNYQVGASLLDAKQRIQNIASLLGLGPIAWDGDPEPHLAGEPCSFSSVPMAGNIMAGSYQAMGDLRSPATLANAQSPRPEIPSR